MRAFSPAQSAYLAATSAMQAISGEVTAAYPPPTKDAPEEVVEAWVDATEALEELLGWSAAFGAQLTAETALIEWCLSAMKCRATQDQEAHLKILADGWQRHPKIKESLLALAMRLDPNSL